MYLVKFDLSGVSLVGERSFRNIGEMMDFVEENPNIAIIIISPERIEMFLKMFMMTYFLAKIRKKYYLRV